MIFPVLSTSVAFVPREKVMRLSNNPERKLNEAVGNVVTDRRLRSIARSKGMGPTENDDNVDVVP